ncbi:GerAB/ArcD/ProY family transporter [Bacillus sp. Marseille-P3661]|uniref:GerAB/ArcD/ProY family transporter n=1 Tax=Bacillus sp. Marseille-P3661 TaxID=1936234 RepID=UPI000C8253C6|nr:endospore germination permease [Bacillus sp. Marseille-P3661]
MKAQGTLKAREMFAIISILIGIKLSDMTPTIYAQTGKNSFWLMPIISFVIIFPSVLLLLKLLERYKTKNLVELTRHILGSKIGSFVSFIFFLTTFSALSIDSRNYVETLSILYFEESPEIALYLTFMLICAFGAKKGFETIGSTAWAVLPYIKISLLLLIVIVMKDVVWLRIFPIFGGGFKDIVMDGVKKGAIFGDLFIITIAYPLVKDTKSFHKGYLFGTFFALFELTLFYLIYCTFFDYKSIAKIAFPYHEITQYVNVGTFFTNLETFFMTFWILAAFIRFILYLYVAAWIFGAIFKIKEFEPLVFILGFISLTVGMLPNGPIINTLTLRENFLNIITPFFVLFPVMLWVVAKFKGELTRT